MRKREGTVETVPTRVLIADDHPLVRSGLRRLVESKGSKVVAEAADGQAAVRLALAMQPHLVLLDVCMPRMGGLEAARQIAQGCPGTHVVMMSGYVEADCRAAAASVGAEAFIEKGARMDTILATIDAVREGRACEATLGAEPTAHADESRHLTAREREVLRLVADGYSSAHIAARLEISVRTVQTHRQSIMTKLGLHSATALTRFAVTHGLA
jgi:DNA-binding NarL/FixJ family response regulator